MRIAVINPNTTVEMTEDIALAARNIAAPGTEIIAVTAPCGPASIEGHVEEICASYGVMRAVQDLQKGEEPDAYVIACYGDPGLEAVRELTEKPVIGIAQASMYMACMLAANFSIITLIPRTITTLKNMATRYGMINKLASIRSTDLSVLDYVADPDRGMEALLEQSKKAVEEDGAEAICLGCAGMVSFTERVEREVGVPVFDGVIAAVKMAEGLVTLKKKTSKVCTYQWTPEKEYKNMPGF